MAGSFRRLLPPVDFRENRETGAKKSILPVNFDSESGIGCRSGISRQARLPTRPKRETGGGLICQTESRPVDESAPRAVTTRKTRPSGGAAKVGSGLDSGSVRSLYWMKHVEFPPLAGHVILCQ
jgi:hypothetical protein